MALSSVGGFESISHLHYLLGKDGTATLEESKVLIVGGGAMGVEVARLLCLLQIQHIGIQDSELVLDSDTRGSTYLCNRHIGINKATTLETMIEDMNRDVQVVVYSERLDNKPASWQFVRDYHCVLFTQYDFDVAICVSDVCRAADPPIPLVMATCRRGAGFIFNDFGPSFTTDVSTSTTGCIAHINEGVVTCVVDHQLQEGDRVVITDKENGDSLPLEVLEIVSTKVFRTTGWEVGADVYGVGEIYTKQTQKTQWTFSHIREHLRLPHDIAVHGDSLDAGYSVFLFMVALHKFRGQHKRPAVAEDRDRVHTIAAVMHSHMNLPYQMRLSYLEFDQVGIPLVGSVCWIAAHAVMEVVKALTHKFNPRKQWLVLSCPTVSHRLPTLLDKRVGVIGCSSVGCELLPLLVGLEGGFGEKGKLTVVDGELIHQANINAHSLFKMKHLKRNKAWIATKVMQKRHPSLKIEPICSNIVSDAFCEDQDIIICTVDTFEARRQVAESCVKYLKPLFVAGVHGFMGRLETVLPNVTRCYSDVVSDPSSEQEFPYCTVKSFPSCRDHCVVWSLNKMNSLFGIKPHIYNQMWKETDSYKTVIEDLDGRSMSESTRTSLKLLLSYSPFWDWQFCIHFATLKLMKYFNYKAIQLLKCFSSEATTEDGSPFWTPPKFMPQPITFNLEDDTQIQFVVNCALLLASVCRIVPTESQLGIAYIRKVSNSFVLPDFQPKEDKEIETSEIAEKSSSNSSLPDGPETAMLLRDWFTQFQGSKIVKVEKPPVLHPVSIGRVLFEEGEIFPFLVSCSNLRAQMYGLAPISEDEVKKIAGNIIPTTPIASAALAATLSLELLNYLDDNAVVNHSFNMTNNLWVQEAPLPVQKKTLGAGLLEVTAWDKWEVQGHPSLTVSDFISQLQQKYGIKISMLLQDRKIIYFPNINPHHNKRKPQPLNSFLDVPEDASYVVLTVAVDSECMEEVEDDVYVPPIYYYVKPNSLVGRVHLNL